MTKYVVVYEDCGHEPKLVFVADSEQAARQWIADGGEVAIEDIEWERENSDGTGRWGYCIGDAGWYISEVESD